MCQVATLSQVQPQHRVTGFEATQIDGRVGLRTAVRLDVRDFGPKKLLGPLDRQ